MPPVRRPTKNTFVNNNFSGRQQNQLLTTTTTTSSSNSNLILPFQEGNYGNNINNLNKRQQQALQFYYSNNDDDDEVPQQAQQPHQQQNNNLLHQSTRQITNNIENTNKLQINNNNAKHDDFTVSVAFSTTTSTNKSFSNNNFNNNKKRIGLTWLSSNSFDRNRNENSDKNVHCSILKTVDFQIPPIPSRRRNINEDDAGKESNNNNLQIPFLVEEISIFVKNILLQEHHRNLLLLSSSSSQNNDDDNIPMKNIRWLLPSSTSSSSSIQKSFSLALNYLNSFDSNSKTQNNQRQQQQILQNLFEIEIENTNQEEEFILNFEEDDEDQKQESANRNKNKILRFYLTNNILFLPSRDFAPLLRRNNNNDNNNVDLRTQEEVEELEERLQVHIISSHQQQANHHNENNKIKFINRLPSSNNFSSSIRSSLCGFLSFWERRNNSNKQNNNEEIITDFMFDSSLASNFIISTTSSNTKNQLQNDVDDANNHINRPGSNNDNKQIIKIPFSTSIGLQISCLESHPGAHQQLGRSKEGFSLFSLLTNLSTSALIMFSSYQNQQKLAVAPQQQNNNALLLLNGNENQNQNTNTLNSNNHNNNFFPIPTSMTSIGRKMLRKWFSNPTSNVEILTKRHDAVHFLVEPENRQVLESLLQAVHRYHHDPLHVLRRIACGQQTSLKDWNGLVECCGALSQLVRINHFIMMTIQNQHQKHQHNNDQANEELHHPFPYLDNICKNYVKLNEAKSMENLIRNVIDFSNSSYFHSNNNNPNNNIDLSSSSSSSVRIRSGIDPTLDDFRNTFAALDNFLTIVAQKESNELLDHYLSFEHHHNHNHNHNNNNQNNQTTNQNNQNQNQNQNPNINHSTMMMMMPMHMQTTIVPPPPPLFVPPPPPELPLRVVFLPQAGFLVVLPVSTTLHRLGGIASPRLPPTYRLALSLSATDAAYFKTPTMTDLDENVGDLHAACVKAEADVKRKLEEQVLVLGVALVGGVTEVVAELECLCCFALKAIEDGWSRPKMMMMSMRTRMMMMNEKNNNGSSGSGCFGNDDENDNDNDDEDQDEEDQEEDNDERNPKIDNNNNNFNGYLKVKNCRHPLLAKLLQTSSATSASTSLVPCPFFEIGFDNNSDDNKKKTIIITGANGSGKSILMKSVAISLFLASIGSFVPCDDCEVGYFDAIYTNDCVFGSAFNSNSNGSSAILRSSFGEEVNQVANYLSNCTDASLLLLDEFGSGTVAEDGISLLGGIVSYCSSLDSNQQNNGRNEQILMMSSSSSCVSMRPSLIVCTHFTELLSSSSENNNNNCGDVSPLLDANVSYTWLTMSARMISTNNNNNKNDDDQEQEEMFLFVPVKGSLHSSAKSVLRVAKACGMPSSVLLQMKEELKIC